MAPLVDLRRYSLPIVPIRLALGFVFLGAARLTGLDATPAAWVFGLGAAVFAVAMLTSRRRRMFWVRVAEAKPVDADAPVAGWAWTIARSMFPSTLAVSALAALALPLDNALAALLAGVLAGMGVMGGVFAAELLMWERPRNLRLLATTGLGSELYVCAAEGATGAAPPARVT